jgi:hypothetical protein
MHRQLVNKYVQYSRNFWSKNTKNLLTVDSTTANSIPNQSATHLNITNDHSIPCKKFFQHNIKYIDSIYMSKSPPFLFKEGDYYVQISFKKDDTSVQKTFRVNDFYELENKIKEFIDKEIKL